MQWYCVVRSHSDQIGTWQKASKCINNMFLFMFFLQHRLHSLATLAEIQERTDKIC